jgi:hypothetical protein
MRKTSFFEERSRKRRERREERGDFLQKPNAPLSTYLHALNHNTSTASSCSPTTATSLSPLIE